MKEKVTAFQAIQPHFDVLARVGYFKLVPHPTSSIKNMLHLTYRFVMWVIIITYNLQHIIRVVQVRNNADQIINTLFILLTTVSTLAKQLAFNLRSQRIDDMFNDINGPVFAPRNSYHEEVMKTNAVTMLRIFRFYLVSAITCGTLWAIFPLVNKALGQDVEFTGYIPFDTNDSPVFECAVVYMNIVITIQAVGNVTMDCTIVSFYTQAKVQLQILRHNLEHLNDKDEEGVYIFTRDVVNDTLRLRKNDEKEEYHLQQKFVQCVTKHRLIQEFIKKIESTFAEAMTIQFFVTAWVICMTLYKIVGLKLFSAEFISMAMYLLCMLAQMFIYCYYGTQVKYESEFINQSAYCGAWLSFSPKFRRQLLFMMEICKRPIMPRTAYIIPISVETYIAVLRASYTLFTVLDRK